MPRMGDLRDAFKKAKLLSGKDVKRLEHEERVHRTQVGREAVEQEKQHRKTELEGMRQAERDQTRRTQDALEKERRAEAELAACLELLDTEARRPASGGGSRFFFELGDGRLPWLEVGENDLRQLQAGALSVVAMADGDAHDYGVIATQHARRIAQVLPARIAHAPRGVVPR